MEQSITLREVYGGSFPEDDEIIWDYVRPNELDEKYRLVEIDPVAWVNHKFDDGTTYLQRFKKASKEQKEIVKNYRSRATSVAADKSHPIVISSAISEVLDGQHRIVAMALEKIRKAWAVDIAIPVD